MERILYLPVETIARELDAKLLLAHRALSKGYSVILGQKSNVLKAADRLGYGIYFYKSHELKNFPQQQDRNKPGFKYVALDEEGLVFLDDKTYLDRSQPNELDHLSIVFTWGSYQRELLIKENPSLASKTIPVGNPRFDLLRPEFSLLYTSAQEKIYKTWGKYVLINTRFHSGNFSRHHGIDYIEFQEHSFIQNRGRHFFENEREFFLKKVKYHKELFNKYQEMLTTLSLKFPDLNFILRPHPSEDHENWKEALKGFNNVHVIFEGSVIEWIKGSLAVIHTGCTTGIESWALLKPVLIYNPNSETGIDPELPNKFGLYLRDVNKLCNILKIIIAGKFQNTFDEQLEDAHLFIESIKGKLSAERIMDALDNLPDIKKDVFDHTEKSIYKKLKGIESKKRALKFQILKWLLKYDSFIRKFAGQRVYHYIFDKFKKYPGIISQFQKFPSLSAKSVHEKLLIFDLIFQNKYTKNYLVKRIATDTYLIDKQ